MITNLEAVVIGLICFIVGFTIGVCFVMDPVQRVLFY